MLARDGEAAGRVGGQDGKMNNLVKWWEKSGELVGFGNNNK